MFSILMTSLTDKPLILQWEVWLRSLLGLKGLVADLIQCWPAHYLHVHFKIISAHALQLIFNNYSPIIPEPEANNCFSINMQVIISKTKRKSIVKHEKNFSSKARQQLAAILFVEVIIGW